MKFQIGHKVGLKHGHYIGSKSSTYLTWNSMKQRCLNSKHKKYNIYGGRGITICESWYCFENFLADMGERPKGKTIDRIDNELGYFKNNCRWATVSEQNYNRRKKLITLENKS